LKNCDYLIVGGGSAGAIVAKRLAEGSGRQVILVEAGRSDEADPALLDLSLLDQQSEATEWGWRAQPVQEMRQQIQYLRAKMLGGCGNHNDCAFLVPPAADFEHWASIGAKGWAWDDVSEFFNKVEQQVYVETRPPVNALSQSLLQAGMELGLVARDFRQGIQQGVGAFPLNARGRWRQSSSVAYLHPLDSLPDNLKVICNTQARKLLFDGNRAVGCVTTDEELFAREEVLLCCGSVHTPHLMMISGIGPRAQLQEFAIEPLLDLPGVGRNLVDHAAANISIELKAPIPDWTLTPCEVTMMCNTSLQNNEAPELLYHFVLQYRDKYGNDGPNAEAPRAIKISPNVMRPLSRGDIRLQSDQIDCQPLINLNYFSDQYGQDMKTMVDGLRLGRRLVETRALTPQVLREIQPGPQVQSDQQLQHYVRQTCETVYHPAGTCRMGDLDHPDTVVGADLRVKGIDNLRVCDASVFPSMVSVNINNTVMMLAEKAAAMILQN